MAKTTKDAKSLTPAVDAGTEVVVPSTTDNPAVQDESQIEQTATVETQTNEPQVEAPTTTQAPTWRGKGWLISNNTPSLAAFPELGNQAAATIKPYTKNVPVTFKTAVMYEAFIANLTQLRELCAWDDIRGVVLHQAPDDELKNEPKDNGEPV